MSEFYIYKGDGTTVTQRKVTLPPYESITQINAPMGYVASPALRDAVNVAIALGQPLLLTGEPGTGKTQLAFSVAYELGLEKPMVFNTKTTSVAKDLFYRYDSLTHFRDSQMPDKQGKIDIHDYITFEALGKSIMDSNLKRSVVLIDEIDKAPRDLPNDLLNELENMQFEVRETGEKYLANKDNRPILIMTSNSEKNLPDAFLRRCIYYHIPFPDKPILEEIIRKRLKLSPTFTGQMVSAAVDHFLQVRLSRGLRKPPATAELLAWVHILDTQNININGDIQAQIQQLYMSYSVLAKNKEDLQKLRGND